MAKRKHDKNAVCFTRDDFQTLDDVRHCLSSLLRTLQQCGEGSKHCSDLKGYVSFLDDLMARISDGEMTEERPYTLSQQRRELVGKVAGDLESLCDFITSYSTDATPAAALDFFMELFGPLRDKVGAVERELLLQEQPETATVVTFPVSGGTGDAA